MVTAGTGSRACSFLAAWLGEKKRKREAGRLGARATPEVRDGRVILFLLKFKMGFSPLRRPDMQRWRPDGATVPTPPLKLAPYLALQPPDRLTTPMWAVSRWKGWGRRGGRWW